MGIVCAFVTAGSISNSLPLGGNSGFSTSSVLLMGIVCAFVTSAEVSNSMSPGGDVGMVCPVLDLVTLTSLLVLPLVFLSRKNK